MARLGNSATCIGVPWQLRPDYRKLERLVVLVEEADEGVAPVIVMPTVPSGSETEESCEGVSARCRLLRPSTAADRGPHLFSKHPKMSISCLLHFAPSHWLPTSRTREVRMTRRPLAAECRDGTTCLRPNALTDHKVSPNTTRQKARHSKWNYGKHLNQLQPTGNVRQTDANESHCCRTTKCAPIGSLLIPRRAPNRQQ